MFACVLICVFNLLIFLQRPPDRILDKAVGERGSGMIEHDAVNFAGMGTQTSSNHLAVKANRFGWACAANTVKGRCFGVNACKGQGACKSAKNDCKGQGWLSTTKNELQRSERSVREEPRALPIGRPRDRLRELHGPGRVSHFSCSTASVRALSDRDARRLVALDCLHQPLDISRA
jgi:hypothetical protein